MIRAANKKDLPACLELLKLLFGIEEDFTFDAEKQLRGLELLVDSVTSYIAIADVDGQTAGMATGQLLISTAEGSVALHVEDVVVAPSFMRQGIGSALVKAVGDWGHTQGASRMQLLADTENKNALEFYKSQNWGKTQLICLRKYHMKNL